MSLKNESRGDLEGWKLADAAEWEKMATSGAVKVLSLEETRRVDQELEEKGQQDRILPTKFARRYKPAEEPGIPPSKKSRLYIRGDWALMLWNRSALLPR